MITLLTNQVKVLIILLSLLLCYTIPFLLLIWFVLREYYDYLFIFVQTILRIRDTSYWNIIIFFSLCFGRVIILLCTQFYLVPILSTITFLLFNILIYVERWTNTLNRSDFQLLNVTSCILHLLILGSIRSILKSVFFERGIFLISLHLSYFLPYFFTNLEGLEWEQYFSVILLNVFCSIIISSLLMTIICKICKNTCSCKCNHY